MVYNDHDPDIPGTAILFTGITLVISEVPVDFTKYSSGENKIARTL